MAKNNFLPSLEQFLEQHKPTCTYWVFSGDRHCSCGRDKSIQELIQIEKLLGVRKENSMKVIVIGGYPGSGKSTIVREVIHRLVKEEGHIFILNKSGKLITYMESNKGLIIFGNYSPGETFPGTDRFPMNVQPEAVAFLEELRDTATAERVVLFEGDRLFNGKMLSFLSKENFGLVLCTVTTEQGLLETRRNKRSEQNETWRKGRATKVDRIAMEFPVHHRLKNDTQEEFEQSVRELLAEIKGEWKSEPVYSKIKDLWR